jgi:hypothetical protein
MNKKLMLIVMFVIIGALVVSAFSWVAITKSNNASASLQRSRDNDAARYTAMAEYYIAYNGASLQRGREADAARYTAMAKYFEAQNSQSGVDIYHQSEWNAVQVPAFHYGPPGR